MPKDAFGFCGSWVDIIYRICGRCLIWCFWFDFGCGFAGVVRMWFSWFLLFLCWITELMLCVGMLFGFGLFAFGVGCFDACGDVFGWLLHDG